LSDSKHQQCSSWPWENAVVYENITREKILPSQADN